MKIVSKQVKIEYNDVYQTKFKKYHKIKYKSSINFVTTSKNFTFVSKNLLYMPVKQFATVLKIIKPSMKKVSRVCTLNIYAYPTVMLTKKPKDIRMGRGKGAATEKVAVIGNKELFSLQNLNDKEATKIFDKCTPKIFKSKQVKHEK